MDLAIETLRKVAYAIVDPSSALILCLLATVLYSQNRKAAFMQKIIMGESLHSPLELTLSQIVLGIFSGVIASLALTYLGVILDESSGIEILFMLSLLLMFYKPRLFCFSYSASVLGLASVFLKAFYGGMNMEIPLEVNVISLVTFVGVLHVVEGLLVAIDGSKGSIPVFTNKDEKILGGFALKRYWPIPVAVMLLLTPTNEGVTKEIANPSWWPLIQTIDFKKLLDTAVVGISAFYGIVGYSAVTFSEIKETKVKQSGLFISIYGLVIIALAQFSRIGIAGDILVLILMPVLHEIMLRLQQKQERNREPIFYSDDKGISILEVCSNSPAKIAGIRSGDKILQVNYSNLVNELEVYQIIRESSAPIIFTLLGLDGNIREVTVKADENKKIGIVLVPKAVKSEDMINFNNNSFSEILDKLKNK